MALSKRLSRICLAVLCLFPAFSSESVFAADASVTDAEFRKADYENLKWQGLSDSEASKISWYSSSNGTLNTAGTIADPGWMFGASTFSPSQKRYTQGPKENLRVVLKTVSDILLVAISALAVLLIAVAGFRMAVSAGNSDEASKGKAMVRYNILAIVVSLMAYTLIEFVSWIVRAS